MNKIIYSTKAASMESGTTISIKEYLNHRLNSVTVLQLHIRDKILAPFFNLSHLSMNINTNLNTNEHQRHFRPVLYRVALFGEKFVKSTSKHSNKKCELCGI